ncbi:MAG: response regulator [Alphaproteobacteria bacterium]|nr:response regulator [Alphaproteobacteria bacterium]
MANRKENVKYNTHPHILVADDNVAMQDAVLTILRVAGFDPDGVDNGEAAIEAVKQADYDLVLMDVDMPKLNGIDATKAIRALPNGKSRVPILAFSGSVTPYDRERFYQAGMDGFAAKPIAARELVTLVEHWTHPEPRTKATPRKSDLPLIEPMTLADLEAMIGIDLLLEILVLFDETACRHADGMRAAVKEKDAARLARDAHDLKSIAGNCGFTRLSRHAATIETACKNGEADRAFAWAREVDGMLAESRACLLATYPGIQAKYATSAQGSRAAAQGN